MTILLDFSPYTLNIFLLFWHHLRSVFFTAVSSFVPRLASSERREELPVWPIGPFSQPAWTARRWACACRYLDGVCFSVAPKWQIQARMATPCYIPKCFGKFVKSYKSNEQYLAVGVGKRGQGGTIAEIEYMSLIKYMSLRLYIYQQHQLISHMQEC